MYLQSTIQRIKKIDNSISSFPANLSLPFRMILKYTTQPSANCTGNMHLWNIPNARLSRNALAGSFHGIRSGNDFTVNVFSSSSQRLFKDRLTMAVWYWLICLAWPSDGARCSHLVDRDRARPSGFHSNRGFGTTFSPAVVGFRPQAEAAL